VAANPVTLAAACAESSVGSPQHWLGVDLAVNAEQRSNSLYQLFTRGNYLLFLVCLPLWLWSCLPNH